MDIFLKPDTWLSLATLTFLEIVLGIDNIIFISLVTGKLPRDQQPRTRTLGLSLALILRVIMLFSITWIMSFKDSLFTALGHDFSIRDIILLGGGIFLLYKSTVEMYEKVEGREREKELKASSSRKLMNVILQIVVIDFVFSFDSILTAIGMSNELIIMITAVIISMIIMMLFSGRVADFINNNPTLQVLALSFLILIGVMLVAEAFGNHVDKAYIYSAIAFSLLVELINMRMRKKGERKKED